jgi:hypothetical protein
MLHFGTEWYGQPSLERFAGSFGLTLGAPGSEHNIVHSAS